MEGNNKTYSSVPPPASLISNAPVDFNNALSKARAIAEKLKQQAAASAAPSVGGPSYASVGSKRGYREGSSEDDKHHARSSRPYARDEHDSKRSSYDSYGRPSSSSRYGGGSDDRKHTTHHNDMSSSSSSLQEECTVPNHMVGLVIGKGGDNLKKIERMSGAKVQFTGDSGDLERRVNIVGEPEQTKIAREMIQQVVDDAYVCEASRMSRPTPSANATGAGMSETATAPLTTFSSGGSNLIITIPSGKVGLVIGRGGETIRDLEERSGAKITVAPEPSSDRPSQRSVNLIGDAHAVQRAKALIDDIVSEDSLKSVTPSRDWAAYRQQHYPAGESGHGRRDEEESDTHRKEGSDTALGSGSGSGSGGGGGGGSGSGAGYPSFATGANAPFDRYGPSSSSQHQDRGYNSGSTSTSGGATTGANTSGGDHRAGIGFRNRFSDERESIQVPKNAVGFLIGRGGETVRSLQDQSGARIKVDSTGDVDGNERTINIFGSTEAIALAKQLVMEKVAEGNANRGAGGPGGGVGGPGGPGGPGGIGGGGGSSRYGGENSRRGGYSGGYSNDRYNQSYGSQYPPSAEAGAGYDYSQYQQYYGQYGYGQPPYGQDKGAIGGTPGTAGAGAGAGAGASAAASGATGAAGAAGAGAAGATAGPPSGAAPTGYEAYHGYPYGYGGYSQYSAETPQEEGAKELTADASDKPEEQSQWTQEAYNQWYQQYYGGHYGAYPSEVPQETLTDVPPPPSSNDSTETPTPTPTNPPAE